MDIERFKKCLKNENIPVSIKSLKVKKIDQACVRVLHPEIHEHVYNSLFEMRNLKGLFKNIRFECEFNRKTGGCKENPISMRCCCHDCLNNIGYIHLMPEQELKYYARHFSIKTGFWRAKGCVLPHHMRSSVCLTHNCNHKDLGYKHFRSGIEIIRNTLYKYRTEILTADDKLKGQPI